MLEHDQIKALRMKLGLNPTAFAALLGASASALCLWESGKRHPRWEMMKKLNELAIKHGVIERQPA